MPGSDDGFVDGIELGTDDQLSEEERLGLALGDDKGRLDFHFAWTIVWYLLGIDVG